MLTVVTWKWGDRFSAKHVNVLRSMLARHLKLTHQLVCVTDDPSGLDGSVRSFRIQDFPRDFSHTPRCRRRMEQYNREFWYVAGDRFLCLDLDVVLVDDITPIVEPILTEPLLLWRVAYANVFSGSFVGMKTGWLHPLYEAFAADPEGFPRQVQQSGVPSDQAMLNYWLKKNRGYFSQYRELSEADGLVTYFGDGYEHLAHHGVGPSHPDLPKNARIVVLGSADLDVLEQGRFEWVREHWR